MLSAPNHAASLSLSGQIGSTMLQSFREEFDAIDVRGMSKEQRQIVLGGRSIHCMAGGIAYCKKPDGADARIADDTRSDFAVALKIT